MDTERILLGHCAVDSGQILLVDPAYVIDGLNYDEVCAAHSVGCDHTNDLVDGKHRHAMTGAVIHDFGQTVHRGYGGPTSGGVVTTTGYGDGYYPVYAEIKDLGKAGKRVARVTIEFLDPRS